MQNMIQSFLRNEVGTNASHRVREEGFIPGVIYSRSMNPVPVQVNRRNLEGILRSQGLSALVSLDIGYSIYTTFIKDIQRHPVTKEIIHLDFQQVEQNEDIHIMIPIILKGRSQIEKSGVIVQQQLKEVEIKCKTSNIPKKLEFDISKYCVGDSIRVVDMEIGEEISIVNEAQSIIASIGVLKLERVEEEEIEMPRP